MKTCLHCGKPIDSRHKFCDNHCQNEYRYTQYIKRWKDGLETGLKGEYGISRYITRYLFEKYDGKCSRCGWHEENPYTHKVPLEVEHIDGNYKNNDESNLDLICPNCHSLTATYKGANKGYGRKERSKYYIGKPAQYNSNTSLL